MAFSDKLRQITAFSDKLRHLRSNQVKGLLWPDSANICSFTKNIKGAPREKLWNSFFSPVKFGTAFVR